MAGDWIKIDHTTPDKPEVFQIAEALEIDPDAVVGKLIRVWVWADQQTRDGNAPSVTVSLLDRLAAVSGFANALESVGWLETTDTGVRFANFDRHNGSPSKSRALGTRRTRQHREMKRECNGTSATKALPEKRREEKSKEETPLPPSLDTQPFRTAWESWQQHRREKRSKLTPTAIARQLNKLMLMGPERAVAAIEHSIANGYTGIFEPDARGSPPKPTTTDVIEQARRLREERAKWESTQS